MKDPIAAAVAQLEAVDLAELNRDAELHTRKDRKYVVPVSMLPSILAGCDLRVLEIDGSRSFRYESVYFDTPSFLSYRNAAQKRRRRFKVRTRSYLDSGLCWLEVKTRNRRKTNAKHRFAYNIEHRTAITDDGLAFIAEFDLVAPFGNELAPALITRYRRITLLDVDSSSRITIDRNVEWETPGGESTQLEDMAIVETKTAGTPCSFDHRLWGDHLRPVRISKYGTGLAALTPGLPANKWNRVLRGHFDWEPTRSTGTSELVITRPDHRGARTGRLVALKPQESLS